MDPKCIIVDEVYENLRSSLLHHGRGRPTNLLPDIAVTNRLLVQLSYLREETGKSSNTVDKWLVKLVPAISSMDGAASHFFNLVESAKKQFLAKQGGERDVFLSMAVDFDFISESLSAVGITRRTFAHPPTEIQNCRFKNSVVVDLEHFRKSQGLSKKTAVEWLSKLGGLDSERLPRAIDGLMKIYDKLKKDTHRNPTAVSEFLTTQFALPEKKGKKAPQELIEPSQKVQQQCSKCEELQSKITSTFEALDEVQTTNKSLQEDLASLTAERNALSGKLFHLETKVKELQSKLALKTASERALKRRDLSLVRQKQKFLSELKNFRAESNKEAEKLCDKVRHLTKKVHKVSSENSDLRQQVATLLGRTHLQMEPLKSAEKNRYSDAVRKTVLGLVSQASVSPSNASTAVQIVAKHIFNVDIDRKELPCTTTATSICDEGHALSMFQVGEALCSQPYVLHLDGTSRDQRKFIGHQVTLKDGTVLSLGFRDVAVEDAETLLTTTLSLLQEVSDVVDTDQQPEVMKKVITNVAAIMSDRAAVMKLFSSRFNEHLQRELNTSASIAFLHCNAHFLLGLSKACEDALKQIELKLPPLGRSNLPQFATWSNSEAATRLIMTANDILGPRGDQKNGCRQEWLAFCEEKGISSKMTSFRSNRFNSFFEGAAAVIHHREAISDFLSSGMLTHYNLKMQSVLTDCADETLILLVGAVAVIFLQLAAPYWKMISTVKFTELHSYIGEMASVLELWIEDPVQMLEFNIFRDKFKVESPMQAATVELFNRNTPSVIEHTRPMLSEILKVVQRQLGDFLEAGKFHPSKLSVEETAVLEYCPVTNLVSERAFGDLDHDMKRRKRSSLHHRSSIHMASQNNMMAWIMRHSTLQQESLMARARAAAPKLRNDHKKQEQLVIMSIRERLAENLRRKNEKELREKQQKEDLVARITAEGGPVRSADDVITKLEKLKNEPQVRQKDFLKDNIRFQKVILNQRSKYLKLTGSVTELAKGLVKFFDPCAEPSFVASAADRKRKPTVTSDSSNSLDSDSQTSDLDSSEAGTDEEFQFTRQGQWVAVFYDQQFYIGQVLTVTSSSSSVIMFLEQTKSKEDYFRFPKSEDVATVEAKFVFYWDFDVNPVSNDGRIWQVAEIQTIKRRYNNIQSRL